MDRADSKGLNSYGGNGDDANSYTAIAIKKSHKRTSVHYLDPTLQNLKLFNSQSKANELNRQNSSSNEWKKQVDSYLKSLPKSYSEQLSRSHLIKTAEKVGLWIRSSFYELPRVPREWLQADYDPAGFETRNKNSISSTHPVSQFQNACFLSGYTFEKEKMPNLPKVLEQKFVIKKNLSIPKWLKYRGQNCARRVSFRKWVAYQLKKDPTADLDQVLASSASNEESANLNAIKDLYLLTENCDLTINELLSNYINYVACNDDGT